MNSIDFIFIGPSKTASTWIYKALSEHPDCSLPKSKDIYFFDKYFERGFEWYAAHFDECDNDKVIGEFSHDYILSNEALDRISQNFKNVKIILCIRNPFERTESGVRFLQRNGYGFSELSELISKHNELIEGSLYAKNLKRVYSRFNNDQVLILNYEELKSDPQKFLLRITNFLTVKDFNPSVLHKKVNEAKLARSVKISYLVKRTALFARHIGLARLVGMLKMNDFVNRLLYKDDGKKFSLSNDDKELLAKYFNDDIRELSEITGEDYYDWLY
ncbi:sulfotransferase domain-containing protein [Ferrimonas balearica]|uniref:sulfotransferase domain-containing protein n=1 Tax=Ferrimonas balearica TaxID=44012 RepID=UPI001C972F80|nr:sulfotransferase domain-containing protein [Ferrimonas balearica]MBY6225133.1 sulfotransferase domain-containing protein [Ferrimonas balearica]